MDTVPLTGSHKSLVWPAHKGWGEYYCRSRRVKLCCGPSQLPARGAVRGRAGVVRTNRNPRRLLVLSCLLESVTGASQAMLVHHNNGGKDAPSSQEPEHQVDPQSLVQLHCGGRLATCQPRVGGFKSGLLLSARGRKLALLMANCVRECLKIQSRLRTNN